MDHWSTSDSATSIIEFFKHNLSKTSNDLYQFLFKRKFAVVNQNYNSPVKNECHRQFLPYNNTERHTKIKKFGAKLI